MPKISVIMPTCNAEKYLQPSIDSILAQTFSDFELLIIDDNSTDKTREIINTYQDKRIKLLDGPCKGIAAALNFGLDRAEGEYIARMDADDISLPKRFEKQIAFMETHPGVGICGTYAAEIDEQDSELTMISGLVENPTIIDALFSCILVHPSVMFRHSFLQKYNLRYNENYMVAEDQEFWARALKVTQIYNLPEKLLLYRKHQENVSRITNATGVQKEQEIRLKLLNWLSAGNYNSEALDKIYLLKNALKSLNSNNVEYWYLFGKILFLQRRTKHNRTSYYLFGKIPLLSVRYKRDARRYYLFDLLPIISIK